MKGKNKMNYKKLNLKIIDKITKVYDEYQDKKIRIAYLSCNDTVVYPNYKNHNKELIELFSYYKKLCLLEDKIYKRYVKLKWNVNI